MLSSKHDLSVVTTNFEIKAKRGLSSVNNQHTYIVGYNLKAIVREDVKIKTFS